MKSIKSNFKIITGLIILTIISISIYYMDKNNAPNNNDIDKPNIVTRKMHVLILYQSDRVTGFFTPNYLENILNKSLPVDLWDIKSNKISENITELSNYSLVIIDQSVKHDLLNTVEKEAIWSAINNGTSYIFINSNTPLYYEKFKINYAKGITTNIWLDHNHDILAPPFLSQADESWNLSSKEYPIYINTSPLPASHKTLIQGNTNGNSPHPIIIYGNHGKGKFTIFTGNLGDLEDKNKFNVPWVITRVIYWLLPDDQPLRHDWPYLSIAFRDDDLGGNWAGTLDQQIGNMSMVLSWNVPITWALASEETSRKIWSDIRFKEKIQELENSGHEIFLHGGGYSDTWRNYNYTEAYNRINGLKNNYIEVLEHPPSGWVTSQHGYSDTIITVLEDLDFKYDSEGREPGTILPNDVIYDVSCRYYRKTLPSYKYYIDRAWLFGPRVVGFITHFYQGELMEINRWIDDLKIFLRNYPHQWATLDEISRIIHGKPYITIKDVVTNNETLYLKIDSKHDAVLYLEIKNSTLTSASANGSPVIYSTNSTIMTNIYGEAIITIKKGAPSSRIKITYSNYPPSEVTFSDENMVIYFMTPQQKNVTVHIFIPYNDAWTITNTENIWNKRWDEENRILNVWTISDGEFTVTISNLVENYRVFNSSKQQ